jgi:bacillithiol biosynthesis deacetylase BshB1
MDQALDVLAIFAHPDDAELLCGGALTRSADLGERVGILDLTRGETASRGSPDLREAEAARAAEIMGAANRHNAHLPDAHLEGSEAHRRVVVEWIRRLRPRTIVTHWVQSRHPDHRVAAELVYDAAFLAGLKNYDAPGQAHRAHKVVHATAFREDAPPPTFVVDITDQIDRKLAAIAAYESQFAGNAAAGEVFPGGERSLLEQIRAQCAHYGSLIRVPYGEPFWCRETVRVPSLGGLEVSTF